MLPIVARPARSVRVAAVTWELLSEVVGGCERLSGCMCFFGICCLLRVFEGYSVVCSLISFLVLLFLASGSSRHFEGKLMSSMEGSVATLLDLFSGGLFGNSVGISLGNLFEGSLQ